MESTMKRFGLLAFLAGLIAVVLVTLAVAPALAAPSTGAPNSWYKDSSGTWFHYNEDGNLETGLTQINDDWYYLNNSTGAMETGWKETAALPGQDGEKVWMYFMPGKGKAATGWYKVGKSWYLFGSSGEMYTGWHKVSGKWYYLKPSGAMAVGWQKVGGSWYYLESNGAMATGWKKLGSTWYYLMSSGKMATGKQQVGSKWYIFASNGAMATGWVKIGGEWYYCDSNGAMVTGWLKYKNNWYYLAKDSKEKPYGAMLLGKQHIGYAFYYFEQLDGGAMVTNEWVELPTLIPVEYGGEEPSDEMDYVDKWYYFGSDGKMVFGDYVINGKTYHFHDELGYL